MHAMDMPARAMRRALRFGEGVILLAVAAILAACASGAVSPNYVVPVADPAKSPAAPVEAAAARAGPALPPAPAPAALEYRLQVGDKLEMRFFHVSQLNETMRIRPDGKISLQLVGEVQAAGFSVRELETSLEGRYSRLLRRPEISINLQEFSPPRVYVGGEVLRPGTLELRGQVTTIQSIVGAGGFTPDAEAGNVVVLRYGTSGEPEFIKLNLAPPFSGSGQQDLILRPFDVVFVPKTVIADVADFFSRYVNNIIPLYRNLGVSVLYNLNRTTLEVKP